LHRLENKRKNHIAKQSEFLWAVSFLELSETTWRKESSSRYKENLLRNQEVFILGSSDACIVLRTKEKIRLQSNRSFFGLFLFWNFLKQSGEMNPVPAAKKTS
jgi:hypothetical protein